MKESDRIERELSRREKEIDQVARKAKRAGRVRPEALDLTIGPIDYAKITRDSDA